VLDFVLYILLLLLKILPGVYLYVRIATLGRGIPVSGVIKHT